VKIRQAVGLSALVCLAACSSALKGGEETSVRPVLDSRWGRVVSECKVSRGSSKTPHVWIFEQWHLAPGVTTFAPATPVPVSGQWPQQENQTVIYRQLDEWVRRRQVVEIYAEGCDAKRGGGKNGEIGKDFGESFNGWNLAALEKAASTPDVASAFDEIISSVPLKLEARHGEQVRVLCADDQEGLKAGLAAFSDARGQLGFLTRLSQNRKDPKRAKIYLDGVIELYRLPAATNVDTAIARLKVELKSSIARIRDSIEKRNQVAVKRVAGSGLHEAAIVFGGVHAPGLVAGLEREGLGCTVVAPTGYVDEDSELVKKLEDALARL
jgi:hypothetical protein